MFEDSLYSFYELFAPLSLVRDLFSEELLTTLTIMAIIIAFGAMAVYYYVLNGKSPKYDGMFHWFLMWFISGMLTFLVVLITCWQKAQEELPRTENPDDGLLFDQGFGTFAAFSFEMMVITLLLFFIFSIVLKGWSTHAKTRPFLWPNSIR